MTPLVELVAIAAQNGWTVEDGDTVRELKWSRNDAVEIYASFTVDGRPKRASLLNYDLFNGERHLSTAVHRGIGNGGDGDEAYDSLMRWFPQRVREYGQPTQF